MAISGTDNKIIIPVKTMLLRYRNKSLIRADQVEAAGRGGNTGSTVEDRNQLDQVIVQVAETQTLTSTAKVVGKMLLRKHNNVQDFDISIPELLLKQQQKTKNIFLIWTQLQVTGTIGRILTWDLKNWSPVRMNFLLYLWEICLKKSVC